MKPEMHTISISSSSLILPRSLIRNRQPKIRELLQTHSSKAQGRPHQLHANALLRSHLSAQPSQLFLSKHSSRLSSVRHHRCSALPPSTNQEKPPQGSLSLLSTSVVFYGAMTAGSIFLGKKYDLVDQFLNSPFVNLQSLPYLGVMMGLFVASTALSEVLPSFKELKLIYQKTLIPQLEKIPIFGLALMAAGAGIGEEALFRGVLQNWVIEQLGTTGLAEFSVTLGVFASSFAFGLAHAITASYFIFAFAAGVVFSVEYLYCGLPAAAFTHAIYDFIAFLVIIQMWGNNNNTDKNIKNEMKN